PNLVFRYFATGGEKADSLYFTSVIGQISPYGRSYRSRPNRRADQDQIKIGRIFFRRINQRFFLADGVKPRAEEPEKAGPFFAIDDLLTLSPNLQSEPLGDISGRARAR